jgi:hypothetical protein
MGIDELPCWNFFFWSARHVQPSSVECDIVEPQVEGCIGVTINVRQT